MSALWPPPKNQNRDVTRDGPLRGPDWETCLCGGLESVGSCCASSVEGLACWCPWSSLCCSDFWATFDFWYGGFEINMNENKQLITVVGQSTRSSLTNGAFSWCLDAPTTVLNLNRPLNGTFVWVWTLDSFKTSVFLLGSCLSYSSDFLLRTLSIVLFFFSSSNFLSFPLFALLPFPEAAPGSQFALLGNRFFSFIRSSFTVSCLHSARRTVYTL